MNCVLDITPSPYMQPSLNSGKGNQWGTLDLHASLSSHDTFHTIWSISWRPIEPSATLRLIGINLTARFCWKITVVVSDVTVPKLNTWITMNKSLYNWTFWWLNLMYSVLLGPSWHRVPADASGCCRGPAVCRAECVLGIRKAAEH